MEPESPSVKIYLDSMDKRVATVSIDEVRAMPGNLFHFNDLVRLIRTHLGDKFEIALLEYSAPKPLQLVEATPNTKIQKSTVVQQGLILLVRNDLTRLKSIGWVPLEFASDLQKVNERYLELKAKLESAYKQLHKLGQASATNDNRKDVALGIPRAQSQGAVLVPASLRANSLQAPSLGHSSAPLPLTRLESIDSFPGEEELSKAPVNLDPSSLTELQKHMSNTERSLNERVSFPIGPNSDKTSDNLTRQTPTFSPPKRHNHFDNGSLDFDPRNSFGTEFSPPIQLKDSDQNSLAPTISHRAPSISFQAFGAEGDEQKTEGSPLPKVSLSKTISVQPSKSMNRRKEQRMNDARKDMILNMFVLFSQPLVQVKPPKPRDDHDGEQVVVHDDLNNSFIGRKKSLTRSQAREDTPMMVSRDILSKSKGEKTDFPYPPDPSHGPFLLTERELESYTSRKCQKELAEIQLRVAQIARFRKVMHLGPLTAAKFTAAVHFKPQILHLMFRGSYGDSPGDPEVQEYLVDFEDDRGELRQVSKSQLARHLPLERLVGVSLVILSGDSSEELLDYFHDRGVPAIIYLKKNRTVNPKSQKEFVSHFYSYLLSGSSVRQAFEAAVQIVKAAVNSDPLHYHRFCDHIHDKNCDIQEMLQEHQNEYHTLFWQCTCPGKFSNLHDSQCLFIEQYIFWTNLHEPVQVGDVFRFCCCHNNMPHEEEDKFGLWVRNEEVAESAVYAFKFLGNAEVMPSKAQFHLREIYKPFYDVYWVGLELLLHGIYEYFQTPGNRVAIILGDRGTGRTTTAKAYANFALQRLSVMRVWKRDARNWTEAGMLETFLEKCEADAEQVIGDVTVLPILLILENFDVMLTKFPEQVKTIMHNRMDQGRVRFLITCKCETELAGFDAWKRFEVPVLDKEKKLKIFYKKYKHNLQLQHQKWKWFLMQMEAQDVVCRQLFDSESVNPTVIVNLANSELEGGIANFYQGLKASLSEFTQHTEPIPVEEEVRRKFNEEYPKKPFKYLLCMLNEGAYFFSDVLSFFVWMDNRQSVANAISFVCEFAHATSADPAIHAEAAAVAEVVKDSALMSSELASIGLQAKSLLLKVLPDRVPAKYQHIYFSKLNASHTDTGNVLLRHEYVFPLFRETFNAFARDNLMAFCRFMLKRLVSIFCELCRQSAFENDTYHIIFSSLTLREIVDNLRTRNEFVDTLHAEPVRYIQTHLKNFLELFKDHHFLFRDLSFVGSNAEEIVLQFAPLVRFMWAFSALARMSFFGISRDQLRSQFRITFSILTHNQNIERSFYEVQLKFRLMELGFMFKGGQLSRLDNPGPILNQKITYIDEMIADFKKSPQYLSAKALPIAELELMILKSKVTRYILKRETLKAPSGRQAISVLWKDYQKSADQSLDRLMELQEKDPLPVQLKIKVMYQFLRAKNELHLKEKEDQRREENEANGGRFKGFFADGDNDFNMGFDSTPTLNQMEHWVLEELIALLDEKETVTGPDGAAYELDLVLWNKGLLVRVLIFLCDITAFYELQEHYTQIRQRLLEVVGTGHFSKFAKVLQEIREREG